MDHKDRRHWSEAEEGTFWGLAAGAAFVVLAIVVILAVGSENLRVASNLAAPTTTPPLTEQGFPQR